MRFIKFLLVIALIAGVGYLGFRYVYTPIDAEYEKYKQLKQNETEVAKGLIFNKNAAAAFTRCGGQFHQMELYCTAYYPSTTSRIEGGIYNAFGRYLIPYVSTASDWSVIPPGSLVYVEGDNRVRYVDDNGSHIVGKDLDLCMSNNSECLKWGSKNCNVWVWIPPNSTREYIKENYLKK